MGLIMGTESHLIKFLDLEVFFFATTIGCTIDFTGKVCLKPRTYGQCFDFFKFFVDFYILV